MTGLSKLSSLLAGKVNVASSRRRSSSASMMPDCLAFRASSLTVSSTSSNGRVVAGMNSSTCTTK